MAKRKNWIKKLNRAGKIISILPDTTEIINRAVDNTRPIIEKELDRHHERQEAYKEIDNVLHLNVEEAKKHLENQGFTVSMIPATPQIKYAKFLPNQVVSMYPKKKKAKLGSLIKLYYLDQASLNANIILLNEQKSKVQRFGRTLSNPLKRGKKIFPKKTKHPKDVTPKSTGKRQ
ncbi:PASTA domain-containing protein [Streptococcus sp. H31]|uniref:PASTA domain-containing protein n=1 Tax=Streptococcus huangxiaojuni TaxID=3237239 RepID=UPI0034A50B1D